MTAEIVQGLGLALLTVGACVAAYRIGFNEACLRESRKRCRFWDYLTARITDEAIPTFDDFLDAWERHMTPTGKP